MDVADVGNRIHPIIRIDNTIRDDAGHIGEAFVKLRDDEVVVIELTRSRAGGRINRIVAEIDLDVLEITLEKLKEARSEALRKFPD